MTLANNDWKNWEEILPVEAGDAAKHKAVASPRPGHADLAGALKFDFPDARYVLERASAREKVRQGWRAGRWRRCCWGSWVSRWRAIRCGWEAEELGRDAGWGEIVASCAGRKCC